MLQLQDASTTNSDPVYVDRILGQSPLNVIWRVVQVMELASANHNVETHFWLLSVHCVARGAHIGLVVGFVHLLQDPDLGGRVMVVVGRFAICTANMAERGCSVTVLDR